MEQQHQQTSQNPAHAYHEPPQVLTTKDLSYLNDMLSWNLLAMKKAHFAAEHCQDASLRSAFEKCGQMHQQHYQQILGHLNTNQPTQNTQQMM
ncbi:hypothetical protein [Heyndrickxia acidicola]|uniref:Spore coat protein n=1 Tax=Heyndrickxia acidicola TaxID=209389 RepID=A0ABU6MIJ3_9BACI|nr:hypothetical protein [Heyndrickxia acidicola]MED1203826.1 hypothetical protein [Heyndrickxia acidicola]